MLTEDPGHDGLQAMLQNRRPTIRNSGAEMPVLSVGRFTGLGVGHCPETPQKFAREHVPKRHNEKPGVNPTCCFVALTAHASRTLRAELLHS